MSMTQGRFIMGNLFHSLFIAAGGPDNLVVAFFSRRLSLA